MTTRELIERHHAAWTSGDIAGARACLAGDLDFQGSIDGFQRAADFVAALRGFQGMLAEVNLLAAHYDDGALLYDCVTPTPAGTIRSAEFFTVRDGRIAAIRLVFDPTELRKLMAG